jgi:nucleoside-diphosphate-sugar epimerase
MKKALITGAAGFLGRHFHKRLAEDGWDVHGIDLKPSAVSWQTHALQFFRPPYFSDHYGLVLHCAAVVGGREVTDGSPLDQAVNLELDAAMFQWALRMKPSRVVYFSSSAVYPVDYQTFAEPLELCEEMGGPDVGGIPDALYGRSKVMGEYLATLAQNEGLPVTIVRPFSGYGEDQDDCYPFPAFVRRARASADPFIVWGDPMQVRDFIHVDDIVEGTLAIAERGTSLPVNLGWGRPVELGSLARMICKESGYSPDQVIGDDGAPMGVEWRVADVERMLDLYKPKVTLEEGIARAVKAAC